MSELEKQNKYYGDVIVNLKDNDDNINEYSTGIKWLPLYELVEFRNGKGHEKDIVNTGKYIVVNSKFISTSGEVKKYSNAQVCPLYKGDILMVMSDLPNGRALAKCFLVEDDDKYTLNQRICALTVKDTEVLSIKFLYYVLNRNKQLLRFDNGVDQTNLRKNDILEILIPVPPIDVQNEIVRILDNFTELTTELTAKLSEEQTARKKQYEYYRDDLLSFDRIGEIHKVKIGDIATDIYRGSGIKRDEVTDDGIPCVRYGEIYTKYGIWFDKCHSHTKLEYVSSPKYFEYGDILFAITGESVEDIAKSTAYVGNEKCLAGGDIVVLKHNQNPKYLSYVLSTSLAKQQKSKGKVKSKVVHSNVPSIESIEIPLPPLDVQERLVEVLDNFDAICSDLSIGLPAEIEARKKQYEFYRDNLLTYIEKGETILTDRQTDRQTSILP